MPDKGRIELIKHLETFAVPKGIQGVCPMLTDMTQGHRGHLLFYSSS